MFKTRHGLCIFVENEFGVIQRITNLFSARGMSIDTIHTTTVSSSNKISQVSISLQESEKNIELMQKLLMRILIVHEVQRVNIQEESSAYISQVFTAKKESQKQVEDVLNQYDLTPFVIEGSVQTYCITATEKVLQASIKHLEVIPSVVLVKRYKVF